MKNDKNPHASKSDPHPMQEKSNTTEWQYGFVGFMTFMTFLSFILYGLWFDLMISKL
jgi:hypothetical protein